MSNRRLYRATGINLKVTPLGEADRIVTILTAERGLVRVVAPGASKQKTQLGGHTQLFVVNKLVLVEGRSLDRLSQADMVQSLPRLRSSLTHLTIAQYWAEVVLYQALAHHPQEELYLVLVEHLERLERAPSKAIALRLLVHGLYHLLAIAGLAPQVRPCSDCPGTNEWSFSPDGGGVACHHCLGAQRPMQRSVLAAPSRSVLKLLPLPQLPDLVTELGCDRDGSVVPELPAWRTVERLLRKSVRYHFDRDIQSAQLVDDCFTEAIAEDIQLSERSKLSAVAQPLSADPEATPPKELIDRSQAVERAVMRVAEAGGSYP